APDAGGQPVPSRTIDELDPASGQERMADVEIEFGRKKLNVRPELRQSSQKGAATRSHFKDATALRYQTLQLQSTRLPEGIEQIAAIEIRVLPQPSFENEKLAVGSPIKPVQRFRSKIGRHIQAGTVRTEIKALPALQ